MYLVVLFWGLRVIVMSLVSLKEASFSDLSLLICDVYLTIGYETEINRTKDARNYEDGVTGIGIMKMIGFMKPSKLERLETSEVNSDQHKKVKVWIIGAILLSFKQIEQKY